MKSCRKNEVRISGGKPVTDLKNGRIEKYFCEKLSKNLTSVFKRFLEVT